MSLRTVATSTLWQLSSQAITMIIGFLSVKLVTTGLSQSLVGNYQTVYAYLQIFGILADFGLYAVAVREYSTSKLKRITFGSLFVLRACITVIALGVALVIAWMSPLFHGTPLPIGISIALFVPFFTLLSGMMRTVFQVEYRMHFVCIAEVIGKLVPLILIGLAVFFGVRESESMHAYYYFLAAGGIGSFLLFALFFVFGRAVLPFPLEVRVEEMKRIFWIAAPYGFAFLATTLYRQSDVTLIAFLRPHDYDIQNALYGVVTRITEVGFLVPTFVLNSALPLLYSRDSEQQSRLFGQILLSLLLLGSAFSLPAFFWSRPIVLLLTHDHYLSSPFSFGSDTALQLLSFSMFLGMIVSFFFYFLLHSHKWKPLLLIVSIGAAFSLFTNTFLIPSLGFVGACITSVASHLLIAISFVLFSLRSSQVYLPYSSFVRFLLFSVIVGLLVYFSQNLLNGIFITLLSGFSYSFLCILLLYGIFFSCPLLNFQKSIN